MISIKNLNKKYKNKNSELEVFNNFCLDIKEGEIVAILGANGSGKSTFARMIAGIDKDFQGEILINEQKLNLYLNKKRIGFVSQKYSNFEWLSVYNNIFLDKEVSKKENNILRDLGLSQYKDFYPHELSGGLQQRVALARALVQENEIIVLDEAFGALDEETRIKTLEFVYPIFKHTSKTVIFITHKIEEAIYLADRVIVFTDKPTTGFSEIEIPKVQRNRDFFFDSKVLNIKKSIMSLLSL